MDARSWSLGSTASTSATRTTVLQDAAAYPDPGAFVQEAAVAVNVECLCSFRGFGWCLGLRPRCLDTRQHGDGQEEHTPGAHCSLHTKESAMAAESEATGRSTCRHPLDEEQEALCNQGSRRRIQPRLT
jgi:hypothetical protein